VILWKGAKVNLRMLHDQLVRSIQRFANDAREQRQVYKRLSQLLPDRLKHMASVYRISGSGSSQAMRAACASNEFTAFIDEVVEIGALSLEARIQYETHMMLIDARRSLRARR
jgi:hypothetical protein